LKVDEEGFAQAMEEQKQKARDNQNFAAKLSTENAGLYDSLDPSVISEFVGYDALTAQSGIAAINAGNEWKDSLSEGEAGTIITFKTPFYATMGGQCADTGIITCGDSEFQVEDTVKLPGDRIGHIGKVVKGTLKIGDMATLLVNEANRSDTCKNHSATHLLQGALRAVLGTHVEQAGSFVNGDRLRFDFSHFSAMTKEELEKTEQIVNEQVALGLSVVTQVMSIEEAKKTGAMALFGEKYGETVRVVQMGNFSTELCGGTHVANTAEIRLFKIISESGVAAGVRRIEALTGNSVLKYYSDMEARLQEAAEIVKTAPAELTSKLTHLMTELKALQSENESLKSKAAKEALGDVMDQVAEIKGVKLLATKVSGVDMNSLRDLGDQLKAKLGEGVIVLISDKDGKVNMVAMATDEAQKKGAHAGNLIKGIAALVGGGGGGRPGMAQAGGKNPAGIDDAIAESRKVLEGQIA
ncbi:MAG: alanine--tRNA ligase, partial [Lachnospiraceae bacterium]|nr:alanine--tRNA ligase [Lachnospiraceae bacterium]